MLSSREDCSAQFCYQIQTLFLELITSEFAGTAAFSILSSHVPKKASKRVRSIIPSSLRHPNSHCPASLGPHCTLSRPP